MVAKFTLRPMRAREHFLAFRPILRGFLLFLPYFLPQISLPDFPSEPVAVLNDATPQAKAKRNRREAPGRVKTFPCFNSFVDKNVKKVLRGTARGLCKREAPGGCSLRLTQRPPLSRCSQSLSRIPVSHSQVTQGLNAGPPTKKRTHNVCKSSIISTVVTLFKAATHGVKIYVAPQF
ncbi:hypothetical protein O3G_MSEX006210 [Manduca sexta]|uniref:Uncharacterized protein n=1 Tax=Manduca sexta TaxID=7130 RepID=A0A922CL19_MANSE|nr:hypothetical protein O3G_MSEX006210 [Manduca sexta]